MTTCCRTVKDWIDRNTASLIAWIVILLVLCGVPQISSLCFQIFPQIVSHAWANGGYQISLGFVFLVVWMAYWNTASFFTVLPAEFVRGESPSGVEGSRARERRAGPFGALLLPARLVGDLPLAAADRLRARGRRVTAVSFAVLGFILIGVGFFLTYFRPDAVRWYPLAGSAGSFLGWGCLLFAAWWAWCAALGPEPGEPFDPLAVAVGRFLALELGALLTGEALWLAVAVLPSVFSYRPYTVWALFNLAFCVTATAALIDVLHWRFDGPVRPVLVGALILAVVFCPGLLPSLGPPSRDVDQLDEGALAAEPDWYDHLYQRIRETDERAPVVFVASSGGGSRAALFTALVLEALGNEELLNSGGDPIDLRDPDGEPVLADGRAAHLRWRDQIVVMSSVSGGSLGNGYYCERLSHPPPALRGTPLNSFGDGLIQETAGTYNETFLHLYRPLWEGKKRDAAESDSPGDRAAVEEIGRALDSEYSPSEKAAVSAAKVNEFGRPYYLSPFADDMCADFMAPLGRGLLTPELERGRALANFWGQRYRWDTVTNRGGFPVRSEGPRRRAPLALFNATDVSNGTRLVVGFPALYPNTFHPTEAARAGSDSPLEAETLADISPRFTVRLEDAIRLSANFPYGIPPARLARTARSAGPKLTTAELDGITAALAPPAPPDAPLDQPSLRMFFPGQRLGDEVSRTALILRHLYPDEARGAKRLADAVRDDERRDLLDDLVEWLDTLRSDGRLSPAVRAWAKTTVEAAERAGCSRGSETYTVLDGGVNDNTGIPTLCDLLEHLDRLAAHGHPTAGDWPAEVQRATRADKAWRILEELRRRRGVVLIEIDSGAKPSPEEPVVLRDWRLPLRGLDNAAYENASAAKEGYLQRLNRVLHSGPSQARDGRPDDRGAAETVASSPVYRMKFTCNHSGPGDVMTAWALPPTDKAKIYATFFCEWREWREQNLPAFRRTWQLAWELRKRNPPEGDREILKLLRGDQVPLLPARPPETTAPSARDLKQEIDRTQKLNEEKKKRFTQSMK